MHDHAIGARLGRYGLVAAGALGLVAAPLRPVHAASSAVAIFAPAIGQVGDTADVVVQAQSDGAAQPGASVTLAVLSGPDEGFTSTALADTSGNATFVLTNTTGPGSDALQASASGATAQATITWSNSAGVGRAVGLLSSGPTSTFVQDVADTAPVTTASPRTVDRYVAKAPMAGVTASGVDARVTTQTDSVQSTASLATLDFTGSALGTLHLASVQANATASCSDGLQGSTSLTDATLGDDTMPLQAALHAGEQFVLDLGTGVTVTFNEQHENQASDGSTSVLVYAAHYVDQNTGIDAVFGWAFASITCAVPLAITDTSSTSSHDSHEGHEGHHKGQDNQDILSSQTQVTGNLAY